MGNYLVLQSDFGLSDDAVSAMYGAAHIISDDIRVENLTHDILPYDIWVVSYRLHQTIKYWLKGAVPVLVVDPDIGSDGRSIVCLTYSGHYIITPDNGFLSHIKHYEDIKKVIEIDEAESRLPYSEESYIFHGRDVYACDGVRLTANKIALGRLGQTISVDGTEVLEIKEVTKNEDSATGSIDILDIRFGLPWTNVPLAFSESLEIVYGSNLMVTTYHQDKKVCQNTIKFARPFADANVGEPLTYVSSLINIGVAVSQDSFSDLYHIGIENDWVIHLSKTPSI